MENFLPFTDDVMVVLVHKCVQQTHLLALHLETLGYIPRLLNALNGLVYFLIIGDPRGDKTGCRLDESFCKSFAGFQKVKVRKYYGYKCLSFPKLCSIPSAHAYEIYLKL